MILIGDSKSLERSVMSIRRAVQMLVQGLTGVLAVLFGAGLEKGCGGHGFTFALTH